MKIAYVITRSDEIGGAHIHVRDLCVWLNGQGHEVLVFVGGDGPYLGILSDAKINYKKIGHMKRSIAPIDDVKAVFELRKSLSEFNPDIVSAHSAKAGMIGRLACSMLKIPCLFTAHGWSFTEGVRWPANILFQAIEFLLSPLSSAIITVCERDRMLAVEKGIAPLNKLRTIHNGMPSLDRYSVVKERSLDGKTPVLVMVARFEEQKDHRTLILALELLKYNEWLLRLVGDGPLLEDVKKLAQEKGISDRIEYLGRRKDVPEILRESDVFILSTKWEGFPRSILEAMRAALPVVASRVAGIPESVIDSETGYLVPVGDHILLSERIRKLLDSQSLRERFGKNARKKFLNDFTFERMAEQTLSVYQEVLFERYGLKE